jgi:hypothetical protein
MGSMVPIEELQDIDLCCYFKNAVMDVVIAESLSGLMIFAMCNKM